MEVDIFFAAFHSTCRDFTPVCRDFTPLVESVSCEVSLFSEIHSFRPSVCNEVRDNSIISTLTDVDVRILLQCRVNYDCKGLVLDFELKGLLHMPSKLKKRRLSSSKSSRPLNSSSPHQNVTNSRRSPTFHNNHDGGGERDRKKGPKRTSAHLKGVDVVDHRVSEGFGQHLGDGMLEESEERREENGQNGWWATRGKGTPA